MESKEQFLANILKKESCWLWQRVVDCYGFPRSTNTRVDQYAHRAMFKLYKGPIPNNWEVAHTCVNLHCINPDHLYILPRNANRTGENNGQSKLTKQQVEEIRSIYKSGKYSQRKLANLYCVSRSTINEALAYKTWKLTCF